jgi:hypothetical protein
MMWQHNSTHVKQGDSCRPMLHLFHRLTVAMGTTMVNLHRDVTAPFVNHHCLMDDRPEECRLFLCISFVPDGNPLGGGGGGNFVPPLVHDWLLECYLLSDPLPPFFGRVSEEGGDL